jgi:phospholipase C
VVSAAPAGSSENLKIIVSNAGPVVELTIINNRSNERPTTLHLPHGGHVDHVVGDDSEGWYDVTITSSGDPRFLRRLAGHVENGSPSISDPTLAR